MRGAFEGLLWRRGDGDFGHARGLCGHDVHDHRTRVDGQPARHVQPHSRHGHPALAHARARGKVDVDGGRHRGLVEPAHSTDGLFQAVPYRGVESRQRELDVGLSDAQAHGRSAVKAIAVFAERGLPPGTHIGEDGAYGFKCGIDVNLGARNHLQELPGG